MKWRRLEFFGHLAFWIITTWLVVAMFSIETQEIEIINDQRSIRVVRNATLINFFLTGQLFAVIFFYLNAAVISKLKAGAGWPVFLKSFALFAGLVALHFLMTGFVLFPDFGLPLRLQSGIFVFYFALSCAYGIARVWQRTESQKQALAFEKQQAELNLLRAQLQPHFLFNTMNNLLAMVDQQANPKLAGAIDRLSGLLRYVVYETAENKVPVAKEIQFIRDFAELQLLRFGAGEVDFTLEKTGKFDTQLIEPGIFVPFVENAFKHGVEAEQQSFVHVYFDLSQEQKVVFSISNPLIKPLPGNAGGGSGLKGVKERLNLVYPEAHKLKIAEDGIFKVMLEIQTHENDHS